MKKILACLLLACLTACSNPPDATDSQNHAIYLKNYRGKWVIVNFWADWCAPCLKELPALNKLYQDNPKKIIVLGVNYDGESSSKLNAFAKKLALKFPLLSHLSTKNGVDEISILPTTLVIDPHGHLKTILRGPHTEKEFKNALK